MWLRCWGAGEQTWLRGGELRLLEVGDGRVRAWAVLGVHWHGKVRRVRVPAGQFAALRGGARRWASTASTPPSPQWRPWRERADGCPLALLLSVSPTKSFDSGDRGEVKGMREIDW